ncbi:MAG: acyl carrier protein [Deltaproteobacteria bacterium]|nr:acyl carrier protein [Deltaproteobacteria bacterium]TLN00933.1 MAG: acyl carrier protein [bacterium]
MRTIDSIRNFISSEICSGNENFIADTDLLIEEGIIDSMGIMLLLDFLEAKYAVHIDGEELLPENFATLAAISGLVEKKTGINGDLGN